MDARDSSGGMEPLSTGRLPIELLYFIFPYLDKPALSACSLVARGWINAARLYLFEVIVYYARAQHVSDTSNTPTPLEDFLVFLESTPSIRRYIRSLVLGMQEPSTGVLHLPIMNPEFTSDGVRGARLDSLYSILRHTQNLQTLTITDFSFEPPESPPGPNSLPGPPALQHLVGLNIQRYAYFGSLCTIEYILSLLGLVGTVDRLVLNTTWSPGDHHSNVPTSPLPADKQLRELHVSGPAPSFGLLKVLDLSSLQVLDIPEFLDQDVEWLCGFLATAGRNLLHLNINLHHSMSVHLSPMSGIPPTHLAPIPFLSSLPLWKLAKLESLSFTFPTWSDYEKPFDESTTICIYEPAHAFIKQTLRTLPPSVRSIGFQVEHCHMLYFADIVEGAPLGDSLLPFSDFDTILESRIAEQGLQTVEVMMNNWSYPQRHLVQQCIAKALPKVCAKGAMFTKNYTLTFESWRKSVSSINSGCACHHRLTICPV